MRRVRVPVVAIMSVVSLLWLGVSVYRSVSQGGYTYYLTLFGANPLGTIVCLALALSCAAIFVWFYARLTPGKRRNVDLCGWAAVNVCLTVLTVGGAYAAWLAIGNWRVERDLGLVRVPTSLLYYLNTSWAIILICILFATCATVSWCWFVRKLRARKSPRDE